MASKTRVERMYKSEKSPFSHEVMDSLDGGERGYAQKLDSDPDVLAWTKNHRIKIKYRNKKGGISRYIPDFLVRRKNTNSLELVEIKGSHLAADQNVDLKKQAAEDWCRRRGMTYRLIKV